MGLEIEVVPSLEVSESLRAEWEQLLCACPNATVFDSFAWIKANLLSFESNETEILAFRNSDSVLTAVIPLVLRSGRRHLRARRWIEFAGQPYADYGSCLVRPGWENPVADSLVKFWRAKPASWDGVYLDKLEASGAFPGHIAAQARKYGLRTALRETNHLRSLQKEEFAAEATMASHSSKSLRKSRKRLQEHGEIGFEVYDRTEQILEHLETFFAWHVERFAAKGLQSPFAEPRHRKFYCHIAEELAPQGRVWLSALSCGGRATAMRLTPLFGGRLHLYSTCFDEAFARYSPSMLQLERLLEYAFQSGIQCVDFGIGESPQKEYAGAGGSTLATVEIYRGQMSAVEAYLYHTAQTMRSRSNLVLETGKLFRRLFPYNVR